MVAKSYDNSLELSIPAPVATCCGWESCCRARNATVLTSPQSCYGCPRICATSLYPTQARDLPRLGVAGSSRTISGLADHQPYTRYLAHNLPRRTELHRRHLVVLRLGRVAAVAHHSSGINFASPLDRETQNLPPCVPGGRGRSCIVAAVVPSSWDHGSSA